MAAPTDSVSLPFEYHPLGPCAGVALYTNDGMVRNAPMIRCAPFDPANVSPALTDATGNITDPDVIYSDWCDIRRPAGYVPRALPHWDAATMMGHINRVVLIINYTPGSLHLQGLFVETHRATAAPHLRHSLPVTNVYPQDLDASNANLNGLNLSPLFYASKRHIQTVTGCRMTDEEIVVLGSRHFLPGNVIQDYNGAIPMGHNSGSPAGVIPPLNVWYCAVKAISESPIQMLHCQHVEYSVTQKFTMVADLLAAITPETTLRDTSGETMFLQDMAFLRVQPVTKFEPGAPVLPPAAAPVPPGGLPPPPPVAAAGLPRVQLAKLPMFAGILWKGDDVVKATPSTFILQDWVDQVRSRINRQTANNRPDLKATAYEMLTELLHGPTKLTQRSYETFTAVRDRDFMELLSRIQLANVDENLVTNRTNAWKACKMDANLQGRETINSVDLYWMTFNDLLRMTNIVDDHDILTQYILGLPLDIRKLVVKAKACPENYLRRGTVVPGPPAEILYSAPIIKGNPLVIAPPGTILNASHIHYIARYLVAPEMVKLAQEKDLFKDPRKRGPDRGPGGRDRGKRPSHSAPAAARLTGGKGGGKGGKGKGGKGGGKGQAKGYCGNKLTFAQA